MEQTFQKEMSTRTIRLGDGGHLTVDLYGDLSPASLLILPGVMSDAHAWRKVAGALTGQPGVAVINRRGRAPSSPLPADYSLDSEVADLRTVLDELELRRVFAWSFGGLVALHLARAHELDQLIAYEPVMAPFAAAALPSLEAAHRDEDWDAAVTAVNIEVSGFGEDYVAELRANHKAWAAMRELSKPVYPETRVINETPAPAEFAARARAIDFIVGGDNLGEDPYGTSFARVQSLTPRARTHILPGQGHMAHLLDPIALATLIDEIAQGKATGM